MTATTSTLEVKQHEEFPMLGWCVMDGKTVINSGYHTREDALDGLRRLTLRKEHLNVDSDAVNSMFELTYSSYLVLPRLFLQAMPAAWQHDFTMLISELTACFEDPHPSYTVHPRHPDSRKYIPSVVSDYRRGNPGMFARYTPKEKP